MKAWTLAAAGLVFLSAATPVEQATPASSSLEATAAAANNDPHYTIGAFSTPNCDGQGGTDVRPLLDSCCDMRMRRSVRLTGNGCSLNFYNHAKNNRRAQGDLVFAHGNPIGGGVCFSLQPSAATFWSAKRH